MRTNIGPSLLLVAAALCSTSSLAADGWESLVDGAKAYDDVKSILEYKAAQAAEVESIFFGLRDALYVMQPNPSATYENSFFTPKTVTYTVKTSAKFNSQALVTLSEDLHKARYMDNGDKKITFKFPGGTTQTITLYEEIMPTYERLVRGGYPFEARAVLLDKDQGVLATSDNSLLLSVPSNGAGFDFSGSPSLRTYQRAEPPDLTQLLIEVHGLTESKAYAQLKSYLDTPTYVLSGATTATFYSLPLESLKRVKTCRVLRDSDQLLLYKAER